MPSRADYWARLTSVSDVLAYSFDLHLATGESAPDWFDLEGEPCVVCATDLANGAYVECRTGATVTRALYVGRGSEAFVLGPDFNHAVSLIVQLPWWREVLQRGSRASLRALREAERCCRQEFSDDLPWLEAAQREVQKEVPLPQLADPVAFLHRWAVHSSSVRVSLAGGVTSYEAAPAPEPRSVSWA